jgi:hypothetical protein
MLQACNMHEKRPKSMHMHEKHPKSMHVTCKHAYNMHVYVNATCKKTCAPSTACFCLLYAVTCALFRTGMRVLDLKNEPWAWPQVQANVSMPADYNIK